MKKLDELDSPQLLPGLEKPPLPWKDRKRSGQTMGELLTEKVGDIIAEDEK